MSDKEDTKFLESAVFWSAYDTLLLKITKIELCVEELREELSHIPNPNPQLECLPENVVKKRRVDEVDELVEQYHIENQIGQDRNGCYWVNPKN